VRREDKPYRVHARRCTDAHRVARWLSSPVDRGKSGRKENWRIGFREHRRGLTKDTASARSSSRGLESKTEAAYYRSDLLQKRIRLMRDWGAFLGKAETEAQNVIPLQKAS
jgi:hypothetical protein